jgi:hypothetical protein
MSAPSTWPGFGEPQAPQGPDPESTQAGRSSRFPGAIISLGTGRTSACGLRSVIPPSLGPRLPRLLHGRFNGRSMTVLRRCADARDRLRIRPTRARLACTRRGIALSFHTEKDKPALEIQMSRGESMARQAARGAPLCPLGVGVTAQAPRLKSPSVLSEWSRAPAPLDEPARILPQENQ